MKPKQLTTLQQAAIATIGAGFIAVAVFIGGSDPVTGAPNPITVEGETIEFTWTDDNAGEDFEIWTDRQTYNDGFSGTTVYAAVKNNSGKSQDVELLGYFVNQRRYIENIAVLTEVTYPGQDIYDTVCTKVKAKDLDKATTSDETIDQCESVYKQKGEDYTRLEWIDLPQMPRDLFEVSKEDEWLAKDAKIKKDTDGYIAEYKSFDFSVKDGEVIYYKLDIRYPANDSGNFFLEAIGSEGGYGHLDPWFDAAWSYRVSVTVDDAQVPTTQTSFPVFVDLSDLPADFHTNVKTDGCDIRVVESDETTETAFELVTYDSTTDTGELHFMADSLTGSGGGDTVFYIYYGNSGASCYAVTDTYGTQNVWSAYEAVWHFQGTVGSTEKKSDATGNGHNLTEVNTPAGAATDQFGTTNGAYDMFGINGQTSNTTSYDYAYIDEQWTEFSNNAFTMMIWFNADYLDSVTDHLFYEEDNGATGRRRAGVTLAPAGTLGMSMAPNLTASIDSPATGNSYTAGNWGYGVGRRNSSGCAEAVLNADHANAGVSGTCNFTTFSSANNNMLFGSRQNTSYGSARRYFDGKLGEARIKLVDVGDDWITAEYNNHNSPATFYTVGTQETNGGNRRIIQTQMQ